MNNTIHKWNYETPFFIRISEWDLMPVEIERIKKDSTGEKLLKNPENRDILYKSMNMGCFE